MTKLNFGLCSWFQFDNIRCQFLANRKHEDEMFGHLAVQILVCVRLLYEAKYGVLAQKP